MIHVNKPARPTDLDLLIDDQHPLKGDYRPEIQSTADLVELLESDKNSEIDARVLVRERSTGNVGLKRMNKKEFIEAAKMTEYGLDSFSTDYDATPNVGQVGEDFVPLLGGPFYRQLYQLDYIKQANAAFYAVNHDPLAHAAINVISDFTLGRGYRVDCEDETALSVWRAFEKVNDLPRQMLQLSREIAIYGESMIWWLPDNDAKIIQRPYPGQRIPKALIPRIRLIDPTVIYEIVTAPEDITDVKFYVWLAPTQYQVFSGLQQNTQIPTSKFIFQQIPASQMMHYKVNAVSNEKRGRSDLFPVLGYLKRLRDSVNYSIIALQKQAAFAIDTTIRGSQSDLQNYIDDQQRFGTFAPAGSEFVHTDAIERKYVGVEGSRGGASQSFDWAFSMFCAGIGIPVSYFGTHLSGGQTRASAIVSTEPVAKRFEQRQQVYERIIYDLWDRVMQWAGLGFIPCEVSFPELITQDRSQKLKDLALARQQGWISTETAASIAAKELNITSFEFQKEIEKIKSEGDIGIIAPLSTNGQLTPQDETEVNALTSQNRAEIKKEYV